jgi:hypothetical protein
MEQKPVAVDKIKIIVWGVRILALLVILFLLSQVINDIMNPPPGTSIQAIDYILYLLWVVYAVGLILGFKDEFVGGAMGISAVLLIIIVKLFSDGLASGKMGIWLIFLAPGLLYFLIWQLKKRISRA